MGRYLGMYDSVPTTYAQCEEFFEFEPEIGDYMTHCYIDSYWAMNSLCEDTYTCCFKGPDEILWECTPQSKKIKEDEEADADIEDSKSLVKEIYDMADEILSLRNSLEDYISKISDKLENHANMLYYMSDRIKEDEDVRTLRDDSEGN